jgi:hypothetical protein
VNRLYVLDRKTREIFEIAVPVTVADICNGVLVTASSSLITIWDLKTKIIQRKIVVGAGPISQIQLTGKYNHFHF